MSALEKFEVAATAQVDQTVMSAVGRDLPMADAQNCTSQLSVQLYILFEFYRSV